MAPNAVATRKWLQTPGPAGRRWRDHHVVLRLKVDPRRKLSIDPPMLCREPPQRLATAITMPVSVEQRKLRGLPPTPDFSFRERRDTYNVGPNELAQAMRPLLRKTIAQITRQPSDRAACN